MSALGRILQVIGWLWIVAGFFGEMIDLPDVGVLPGIVLLLISRVLRGKVGRRRRPEPDEPEGYAEREEPPRPLNTERPHRPVTESAPEPMREEGPVEEEPSDLLERVLLAGQELAEDSEEPQSAGLEMEEEPPLSSAEMIARAHRRWDRRSQQ